MVVLAPRVANDHAKHTEEKRPQHPEEEREGKDFVGLQRARPMAVRQQRAHEEHGDNIGTKVAEKRIDDRCGLHPFNDTPASRDRR